MFPHTRQTCDCFLFCLGWFGLYPWTDSYNERTSEQARTGDKRQSFAFDRQSIVPLDIQSQPQIEFMDKIMTSKPRDHAKIRCVCLPDHEHARVLLQLYLERVNEPPDHVYDAPTLNRLQEGMYIRLSRAEIPNHSKISLF